MCVFNDVTVSINVGSGHNGRMFPADSPLLWEWYVCKQHWVNKLIWCRLALVCYKIIQADKRDLLWCPIYIRPYTHDKKYNQKVQRSKDRLPSEKLVKWWSIYGAVDQVIDDSGRGGLDLCGLWCSLQCVA